MAKYNFESEKYIIRPIEEQDKEQVKDLLKENKYMKKLLEKESMSNLVDSVIESVYINSDSGHCIISKETGAFCGYMEISLEQDGKEEGELSIRLLYEEDMGEIMKMFGKAFNAIGIKKTKDISIQYEID